MTSVYPKPVDALMPDARRITADLGHIPSRNHLMSALHVGRDKANAVLARLTDEATTLDTTTDPVLTGAARDGRDETTAPVPPVPGETGPAPVRRLHAVPDAEPVPVSSRMTPAPAGTDEPVETLSGQLPDPAATEVPPGVAPEPNITAPAGLAGMWRRWTGSSGPAATSAVPTGRPARTWPLVLLALPAFVAIWSGWVGLGTLTGFGPVHPLPGIADHFSINTAITLPIGVETYAAYALRVWLAGHGSRRAREFAKRSAIGALVLGAAGQVAYHLMTAQHVTAAPWEITTAVACLPVIVLGCGAALAHLQHTTDTPTEQGGSDAAPAPSTHDRSI